MHGILGVQFGFAGDDMGVRVGLETELQSQPVFGVHIGQIKDVPFLQGIGKAEFRQQRFPVPISQDQAGLAGKAGGCFGADRQIGVCVQHSACDVNRMGGVQGGQVLGHGQGRAPIDHLWQAVLCRRQHKRLAAIVDAIGPGHVI